MLRCAPLEAIASHFFTDAGLRLRDAPDDWQAVAALAGVGGNRLRLLHQVHGRRIVVAGDERDVLPEADGIISDDPSVALVVRVADCAPLLIADRRRGAVAAVHAGWRSTMQRIAAEAVHAMAGAFGSDPSDLVVAIGPSLGDCCGEMGDEVIEAFGVAGHPPARLERWFVRAEGGRPHFDLWRANADQLAEAGVPSSAIHASRLCTRTYPATFHSYRAAGAQAGRMAAVIRANR